MFGIALAVACGGKSTSEAGATHGSGGSDAHVDASVSLPPGDASNSGFEASVLCRTTCGECPPGTACLERSSFSNNPIVATCLRTCNATDECESGEICLNQQFIPSASETAFCVSDTRPAACGSYPGGHCDFFGYTECRDAKTLMKGVDKIGALCGYELIRCETECTGWPLDDAATTPAKCL